ncbi:MAG: hypothetical protein AB7L13_18025 [Acidimicrobiia bacterium]
MPGSRGAAGVAGGQHGAAGAAAFVDDGAITAQIIDAAQIDELLALLGHGQPASPSPPGSGSLPPGAHGTHGTHGAHGAQGALAYRTSGGTTATAGSNASPSAVLGELGPPVPIGTALVDLARLASDHQGRHVKAFMMRTGIERDRIVMITEDWSALAVDARHDSADVAKTIAGALDRAVAKAYASGSPPVRADVRALADGRFAIALVAVRPAKISVAAIATNAGFELFAEPAPAAAVNLALHTPGKASDSHRAASAASLARVAESLADRGPEALVRDHAPSVVDAMVASVADRIDDARSAFGTAASAVAGGFAAAVAVAGRAITAPLAAMRAGRQGAAAVAVTVALVGLVFAFTRDFDALGLVAGAALLLAAVGIMAVVAGTLVRGGSGRQTGG